MASRSFFTYTDSAEDWRRTLGRSPAFSFCMALSSLVHWLSWPSQTMSSFSFTVLDEVLMRMWQPVDSRGNWGLLTLSTVLGMHVPVTLLPLHGHSLERLMCCWDHLDCVHDWMLLRPPYRLFRWVGVETSAYLEAAQDKSPVCVPLLVKTCSLWIWEWSASFFTLSLPSVCGGWFYNLSEIMN